MRSFRNLRPVVASGMPQPWLTMPAIRFLDSRLRHDHLLFEYGSGGSTAWFAQRVEAVVSVEQSAAWYEEVIRLVPANARVNLREVEPKPVFLDMVFHPLGESSDYARAVRELPSRPPDVVVIDGRDRLNCIAEAMTVVSGRGVILADNLEYEQLFAPAVQQLVSSGWRDLRVWGLAPGELRESCTGIFYRDGNCLGI